MADGRRLSGRTAGDRVIDERLVHAVDPNPRVGVDRTSRRRQLDASYAWFGDGGAKDSREYRIASACGGSIDPDLRSHIARRPLCKRALCDRSGRSAA